MCPQHRWSNFVFTLLTDRWCGHSSINDSSRHASAIWDGQNDSGRPVASGIYFYRLSTGKTTLSRKMLLLK